ncbi:MAG: LLM class flavin-dependent oxidoreductase, partial [Acidimicrobiales bacterium]|nr:LLM class flavin-dependent oxidoreductase [Acidimicrobiales bacterium]
HTLMTPFFNPGPNEHGPPRVFISAVGPLMTEVAGEVCDGLICHAFSTEKYLREVTLPRVEAGLAKSGRTMDDFEVIGPGFVVTGPDEEAMARAATGIRQQIAFYASTPAYRGVLEIHGWEGLQTDLNTMSKRGEWQAMGELIDDEMLDAFAVVAEPDSVAAGILDRYGDCVDRMTFYALGGEHGADFWAPIVADLAT